MARIEIDPNYNSPTFSRATAAADLFKKEDVQALAAAMSAHVHDGTGKGLVAAAVAANAITSAMIANGTIVAGDMAAGAAASNVGALGGVLGGTLPNPTMAAGAALANLAPSQISLMQHTPFGAAISTTSATLVGTGDIATANLQGEKVLIIALMPLTVAAGAAVTASLRVVTPSTSMPYPVVYANKSATAQSVTLIPIWFYQTPPGLASYAFETMYATSLGTVAQAAEGTAVRQTLLLVLAR